MERKNKTPTTHQQRLIIIKPKKNLIQFLTLKIKNTMKKLKSIIAICAVAALIASCKKDDNAPLNPPIPSCQTECLNGGTVNSNCGCDCPTGYTGTNCQTVVPPPVNYTTVQVNVNSLLSYQLPPIRYAGDNEFGGHIRINGSIQLTLGSNSTKIYAVVNATYIESAGGMDTKAKIDGNLNSNRKLLYTAPAGKKVYSFNSTASTSFYWYPSTNYHGTGNLYPGNFVYRIEMIGDTSGDDLPSDGTTERSRFRIWFND